MNIKQHLITISIGATLTLFSATSQAITVEEVTNPRQTDGGWVTDMADILSSETEDKINRLIDDLERADGTEIAVVTVPKTAPAASPKAFATELFNYWGIGKAELDNGILFLISEGDNRVEIETGYGITQRLSNEKVTAIIDRQILPQYRTGNFNRGTLVGMQALIQQLKSDSKFTLGDRNSWLLLLTGTGAIAIIGKIFTYARNRQKVFVRLNNNLSLEKGDSRTVCCEQCRQPLERVRQIELTEAQKVAQKLKAVKYCAYRCPNCQTQAKAYSLLAYITNSDRYDTCPQCQELTMLKTSTAIAPAQQKSLGELLVKKHCHCCGLEQEAIELLPVNKSRRRNPSHYQNHHYYYGDYSSGGDYGGGSSGADFGGGASGGDGGGGSW